MNEDLTKAYTEEEVVEALTQMSPTKASGPDGMAPIFYQKFCGTVGKPTTTVVLQTLNQGEFPTSTRLSL